MNPPLYGHLTAEQQQQAMMAQNWQQWQEYYQQYAQWQTQYGQQVNTSNGKSNCSVFMCRSVSVSTGDEPNANPGDGGHSSGHCTAAVTQSTASAAAPKFGKRFRATSAASSTAAVRRGGERDARVGNAAQCGRKATTATATRWP